MIHKIHQFHGSTEVRSERDISVLLAARWSLLKSNLLKCMAFINRANFLGPLWLWLLLFGVMLIHQANIIGSASKIIWYRWGCMMYCMMYRSQYSIHIRVWDIIYSYARIVHIIYKINTHVLYTYTCTHLHMIQHVCARYTFLFPSRSLVTCDTSRWLPFAETVLQMVSELPSPKEAAPQRLPVLCPKWILGKRNDHNLKATGFSGKKNLGT